MILENEICIVKIYVDETYTVNSTDNHHYDFVDNYYEIDFEGKLIRNI